jgi:hypothetical protein
MPREIVRIDLSSKFPIEVGARFFSVIAYPDNARERDRYSLAISRLYVQRRAENDPEFGRTLHYVVPAIFRASWLDVERAFKTGNKYLRRRIAAARWIVMPHLRGEGLKPIHVEKDGQLQAVIPTLNNMGRFAMDELGWRGTSKSMPTLKSKIWAPSRPVIHAAAACLLWCKIYADFDPEKEGDFFFLACLEHPSTVGAILRRAEKFRLMLPSIEQFQIKEEDTIQFFGQGSPVKFRKSKSTD